jgi:hypothetical protein
MRHICMATCFAIKHLYFRNKLVRCAKSQERIWKTRVNCRNNGYLCRTLDISTIFHHTVWSTSLICWHNYLSLAQNQSHWDRCTLEEQSRSCSQTAGVPGKVRFTRRTNFSETIYFSNYGSFVLKSVAQIEDI